MVIINLFKPITKSLDLNQIKINNLIISRSLNP